MKNTLPEYLRMHADAAPKDNQVFVCGDTRFTVITPSLIRIERGAFTDEATLTVLCRGFCACDCSAEKVGEKLILRTDALTLEYDPALPLEEGLTIRRDGAPTFLWHYGQKPLQNLGGTTSTLDEVDGACEIEDGVCAIDGFAFIDDSKTPVMTRDGWFAPRKECSDVYFFGY
ncbi:MAG: alpha-xylosidase, partial [Clostridia bacterium]|nr:alpha-xylosidase [Clostridia bacterium]